MEREGSGNRKRERIRIRIRMSTASSSSSSSSSRTPLVLVGASVAAVAAVAVLAVGGRRVFLLPFDIFRFRFGLGGKSTAAGGDDRQNAGASTGTLVLKVRSGRDAGKSLSLSCKDGAELTMGRLESNMLLFTDEEVSGRHATATYDTKAGGWRLRDLGSLNGTRLNGKEIGEPGRRTGAAVVLRHGDIVTLGETTTLEVIIGRASFRRPNFVWSVRGQPSRKHIQRHEPSEDEVTLSLSPDGTSALYVFDGHCGRTAVEEAAEILPAEVAARLPSRMPDSGAKDELTQAFIASDSKIHADHAGCTATVAIIWPRNEHDWSEGCYIQVANVGDSVAVASHKSRTYAEVISSSHRLTDADERARLQARGLKLREGEKRLYGLQISRVIGDRFLKSEDVGLTAEPSVSDVLFVGGKMGREIVIIATDGLWDEIEPVEAISVAIDAMNKYVATKDETNVQAMVDAAADALISKARGAQGLVDDTTVLVLKFDKPSENSHVKPKVSTNINQTVYNL